MAVETIYVVIKGSLILSSGFMRDNGVIVGTGATSEEARIIS